MSSVLAALGMGGGGAAAGGAAAGGAAAGGAAGAAGASQAAGFTAALSDAAKVAASHQLGGPFAGHQATTGAGKTLDSLLDIKSLGGDGVSVRSSAPSARKRMSEGIEQAMAQARRERARRSRMSTLLRGSSSAGESRAGSAPRVRIGRI